MVNGEWSALTEEVAIMSRASADHRKWLVEYYTDFAEYCADLASGGDYRAKSHG